MSDSLNTTKNKFYETVNFDKGSDAKGLLLPTESGRIDLGSSSKKFDNVYANNFSGSVKSGTWRPQFTYLVDNKRVSSVHDYYSSTGDRGSYQKTGKVVWAELRANYSNPSSQRKSISVWLRSLPFPFYYLMTISVFPVSFLATASDYAFVTDVSTSTKLFHLGRGSADSPIYVGYWDRSYSAVYNIAPLFKLETSTGKNFFVDMKFVFKTH